MVQYLQYSGSKRHKRCQRKDANSQIVSPVLAEGGLYSAKDLTILTYLAESWWQPDSKLHMLARMNPARFAYFDTIVEHWQGLCVIDHGVVVGLKTWLTKRGHGSRDLSCACLRARCVPPCP